MIPLQMPLYSSTVEGNGGGSGDDYDEITAVYPLMTLDYRAV